MIKLDDKKRKDLSVLMSKVYSRKYGKEVKVTYGNKKDQ